jgi:phosphatidylglycerol:prolipoprotein diacylglycerol transferase
MNIAVLVIALLLAALGMGYLVYFLKDFLKNPTESELSKKEIGIYAACIGAITVGFTLLLLALFLFHPEWKEMTSYSDHLFAGREIHYPYQIAFALIGMAFFALTMSLLWSSFVLHYYKSKMKDPQKRVFSFLLWGDIPFALLFFLMWTEGLAPYLSYPLINGFSMTGSGWIWTRSSDIGNYQPLHIAFYGIIILFGVCVAYWISDHKFYQEFHKHGILDTVVLVAFPSGVIGARIWYVVGNYEREFASQVAKGDVGSIFRIWDGGLTILGGAFAGVLAGVLFLHYRRKYVNLRWAMDVCLPTILLAQAIGRWGNFFNSEVYGATVKLSDGWNWLPTWIALQMNTSNGGGYLASGMIHVPLFLIESLLNIGGYFLLVYGMGRGLRRFLVKGDIAGGYFLWYGVVRLIMEPMRDSTFNMGADNSWSISNSIVYIVLGLGLMVYFHLHDYLLKKEHSLLPALLASLFGVVGLFFLFLPSLTASTGSGTSASVLERYQGFALLFSGEAPALLAAFILALVSLGLYLSALLLRLLKKEKAYSPLLWAGFAASLISAAMFFLGKNWTLLPKSDSTGEITYTLSYGFVLFALAFLWASSIALAELYSEKQKAKRAEIALKNGESDHPEAL